MSQDGYNVEVIGEVSSDFYFKTDIECCLYAL